MSDTTCHHDRRLYLLALALAMASGMAALMHQLLWTRRLIDLLGASHESAARVFGMFFLGLALGAALAAWLLPRITRPWRWVAVAEAMVIVLSVPAMFLSTWTQSLWPTLGPEALGDWRRLTVKTMVSLLVITPPAMAMGLTLPWLGAAVLRGSARLGREGLWLYAINTFGGVIGLFLAVACLLHLLGVMGTFAAAVLLSVLVIALALTGHWMDRSTTPTIKPVDIAAIAVDPQARQVRRWVLLAAFLSGGCILAFEVAALQMLMLVAPLSFYAPAAMLMVIIAMLALGAAMTPWLVGVVGSPRRLLVAALTVGGLATTFTPVLFFQVIAWLHPGAPQAVFILWLAVLCLVTLLVLGPALLAAGLVFPAALAWLGRDGADAHGRTWGWFLAANGIGGLLGAELAYRLLLPLSGPHSAVGLVGLVYLGGALVLGWCTGQRTSERMLAVALPTLAGCLIWFFWLPSLPLINQHVGMTLVDHRSGREGTVAVVEIAGQGRALLMSNQYVLGSTMAQWDQARQAHLPLLLHPAPRQVATIGMATGMTAGAVLEHPQVEKLTVVELSPLVADMARRHFASYQQGLFDDPRTQIVIEDGRTHMAAEQDRFDVVIGDLFLPWGPGEGRLYAREHFQAVARSLRPGGLFCQWLPMYQLTPEQFKMIAATFQQAFADTWIVLGNFSSHQPVLGLVGFRDGHWQWDVVEDRAEQARAAGLKDPLMRHREGVALMLQGKLHAIDGPCNTLNNMWVELDAGQKRATGAVYHHGPRWLQTLEQLPVTPDALADAPLSHLLVAWELERSQARPRRSQLQMLALRLPWPLKGDADADPSRWPGDPRVLQEFGRNLLDK